MTLSNITCSASAGEASGSSGTRTTDDGNTAPPAATPATTTTTVSSGQPPGPGQKRKRNLPGTPDPEAEVVALSPKTLMATNRFVCEICNKGFQRDQNLQLHRRGHNLPWKLRQRSSKEIIRKRVYICPEASCVHHDPSRALGDLTGIKKHFCRKHGEKKWKCDKCSKRYAVQSDWKAHSKTCGTREYRCDCGTLFSRRDSFITHRAFCDALAEESARVSAGKQYGGSGGGDMMSSSSMMMQATQVGGSMSVLAGTLSLTSSPHHGNNMNLGRVSADSLASIAAATGGGGGSGSMQRQAPLAPSMGGLGRLGHEAAGLSLLPPRWGQSVGNAGAAASATGAPGPRLSLWLGSGPGPAGGLPAPGSQQVQLLPAASDVSSSSPFLMQPPKVAMHDGGAAGLQPAILNPLEYDIPQAPRPTSSSGLLLPMVSSGTGSMFAHLFSSAPGSTMPGLHGGSSSTNNNIPANTAGAGASMLLQGGMGISGFSDFTAGASQTERRGGGSATAGLSLSSSLSAGLSSCSSSVYNDGVGSVPSVSMLFNHQQQQQQQQQQHTATAQMSATALLQKAAQMGATASSSSSLLRGFGGMGVPGDSSSMSFWQNQQQRMQDQGRGAVELPPNKLSMVQSLQQQQQQIRRPIDISSGGGPLGVGTSMGPSNFGGSQVRPTNDHHVGGVAAAAAAAGMQDFMNSLSGGAGLFVGPLSNMPSMFGPNSGNVTGGMMQPPNNHHHHHHRMLPNDVMAHHHNNNPYHSGGGGGPMSQGMGGQPSSMLPGLGGSTRGEDGSDRFTHDFLGVGGAPSGMAAAAAGGMGRTLSQRDLASLASLGPGVDLGAIFNQRENLRSVGARVHSPAKSWDAS